MKKYAIITESTFGKLWYFEENLPAEWWTPTKSKAMLFNTLKGAETKALWVVGQHPDMIGAIQLYEGEETEFGKQKVERRSLAEGPAGDILGTIFDTLFGGKGRGSVPDGLQRGGEAPPPNLPEHGGEGNPPKRRDRRRPS